MSFELDRSEIALVQTGFQGLAICDAKSATPSVRRQIEAMHELRRTFERYTANGSNEPLTLDSFNAPFVIDALQAGIHSRLPAFHTIENLPTTDPEYLAQATQVLAKVATALSRSSV